MCLLDVDETDLVGVLTEALTADVQTVLADDGLLVTADAAVARALTHLGGGNHLLAGTPLLEVTHTVRESFPL